ncbi:hypothetical protein COB57_05305 [Candidatus Peregrinibacteria bacterium]|nr:MAG: hypothetical protein COB57_05305 [Candidatus Peregrinibacteria bacterium]
MIITGLGHSELIVEMKNKKGNTVRLLSDAWLSDYAFGDFMERFPRLNIDWKNFPKLDGVFLSHAHCDHFDPYTLVELYKHQQPEILIPETLTYLEETIRKHLPEVVIHVLADREVVKWKGLELYGIIFRQTYLTNEDDVMTLSLNNKKEFLYIEVDTAIPETEEAHRELWELFRKRSYETVCHISTRNELGGIFKSLDAKTTKERKIQVADFLSTIEDETAWDYMKHDDGMVDYPDISRVKNLVRLFNGQGIVFPQDLGTQFDPILVPLTLEDTVKQEQNIAGEYGRDIPMSALLAGNVFDIQNGKIPKASKAHFFQLLNDRDFRFQPDTPVFRIIKNQPVNKSCPENLTNKAFWSIFLSFLNERFMPYQLAHLDAPLREMVLRSENKKFTIAVKFGSEDGYETEYCSYSFETMKFVYEKTETQVYSEIYWANDLVDLFAGRQEMFSTFLHALEAGKTMHFWTCLGMPFVASDCVQKKMELHFQRAAAGKDVASYLQPIFKRALGERDS